MNNKTIDAIRIFSKPKLEEIFHNIQGLRGIIISTVDGFEVAYVHSGDVDPARVSAMASSISAIGSVVAQESSIGEPSNVTIYSDSGFMQIFSVKRTEIHLIINIISDSTGVLAQVTYHGKQIVRALADFKI